MSGPTPARSEMAAEIERLQAQVKRLQRKLREERKGAKMLADAFHDHLNPKPMPGWVIRGEL